MKIRRPGIAELIAIGLVASTYLGSALFADAGRAAPSSDTSSSLPTAKQTFPVVAHSQGAGGTSYKTDLTIVNQSAMPTDVLLQFRLHQGPWDYDKELCTETITVGAGEQKLLEDLLKSQFNIGYDVKGSMQLSASGPIVAVARIYNDRREENRGTFGQFVEGLVHEVENTGLASPLNGALPALSDSPIGSGPYRTNIGMFNDGTTDVVVTLRAFDTDGTLLAISTFWPVHPQQTHFVSVADLFPAMGSRQNFYITYTADGPTLSVYASVVDNVNGDAIYIPARSVTGALEHTFPVVARAIGANGASFSTDMWIMNPQEVATSVRLEFYPGGGHGNAESATTRTINMAPGEESVLDDLVKSLFAMDKATGALQIFASQPVIAVARIYNDQRASGDGTFGQFVDGVNDTVATRASRDGLLPALSDSAGPYRTNIGWFNGGPSHELATTDANLTLRAFDANGALLATRTIAVPAYSQLQQSVATIFPALGARENFYVTYSTDVATPLYVYASVIDNVTGDATYIPAQ